jgi:hypothetical protein
MVSSFEQQARDMNAAARLGAPTGEPARYGPLPLGNYAGSIVLVLGGIVCLFGLGESSLQVLAGIGAAICFVPGAYLLWRRGQNKGTVTPHERGVSVTRGARRLAFAFEDLERVTIAQKEQLNNGVRVGLKRSVVLRSSSAQVAFDALTFDNTPDVVGAALSALARGAAQAAEMRVATGGGLRGAGWSLDGKGLRAGRRPPAPLAEVSGVGIHQQSVTVWRGEESEAFLTVPAGSPNARVLHALIARRLEGQPERPTRGMGRLLFQKAQSLITAGAIALLGSLTLVAGLMAGEDEVKVICGILGLVMIVGAAVAGRRRFQAFEMGLVRRTLFRERTVLYADVERLTYVATRHYYNGAYTGTSLSITCGTAHGRLTFTTRVHGQENDLEGLRDHMARIVARKLHGRLQQEAEVPWCDGVKISRAGLRFRRRKMIGRGEEVFRPWSELRFSIQEGFLHLFEPDQKTSTASFPCAAENFYPGLVLFETLPAEAAAHPAS